MQATALHRLPPYAGYRPTQATALCRLPPYAGCRPFLCRGCLCTVNVLQATHHALQVTVSWPAASPVEYAWLKDAATGEVT